MTYEIRSADLWPDVDYEIRAAAGGFDFEGYAAVYGVPSRLMSFPHMRAGVPFREVIHRGAFTKTLAEQPVVTLRFQHNIMALPLASTKAGTMTLAEDDHGLRVRATLPDNEWGRPVRDAIARGDISGMSYRFKKVIDKWAKDGAENVRHLHEIRLDREISVTEFPAFDATSATVRELAEEADVDPDALVAAFGALKPEARLTAEQRDAFIAVINSHSDLPVIDAEQAAKKAQMRERLAALAG